MRALESFCQGIQERGEARAHLVAGQYLIIPRDRQFHHPLPFVDDGELDELRFPRGWFVIAAEIDDSAFTGGALMTLHIPLQRYCYSVLAKPSGEHNTGRRVPVASIQKLSSGYRVRVEIDPDPATGKRRWHSEMAPTLAKAKARAAALENDVYEGRYARVSMQPLGEYLTDVWLPFYRTYVRESTLVQATSRITCHIIPHLGRIPLGRLKASDIQALYSSLLAQGMKPSTVRALHMTLTTALGRAVQLEMLRRNPTKGCMPGRVEKRASTLWTHAEIGHFLQSAEDSTLITLISLIASTGMRRGEALALQWPDIDFYHNTMFVQRTITRKYPTGWTIGPPKSETSRRLIALPVELLPLLQAYRQEQQKRLSLRRNLPKEAWVFDDGKGDYMTPDQLKYRWYKARKQSGLNPIRVHDLRHGAATTMLEADIPLKVVSEHLGHSSITITADVYQHVTQELSRKAAQALGGFLSGAAPEGNAAAPPHE